MYLELRGFFDLLPTVGIPFRVLEESLELLFLFFS